jgi:hypothetical protein
LTVERKIQQNFHPQRNYTWSHTFDDGTFTTFVSTPQDLYDRKLEYANSNQDVRQRFITNFSIEGPKDSFLRNFIFGNIVMLQTPSARPAHRGIPLRAASATENLAQSLHTIMMELRPVLVTTAGDVPTFTDIKLLAKIGEPISS